MLLEIIICSIIGTSSLLIFPPVNRKIVEQIKIKRQINALLRELRKRENEEISEIICEFEPVNYSDNGSSSITSIKMYTS